MTTRWWRAAAIIGLTVAVLSGCVTDQIDGVVIGGYAGTDATPIRDLDQTADRYCQARERANQRVALYRALRSRGITDRDVALDIWLQNSSFADWVIASITLAHVLDPREIPLNPDQEADRPQLTALVCERCPELTVPRGDPETDVLANAWAAPLCEAVPVLTGVWVERGVDMLHDTWQSVWIIEAGPDGETTVTWELLTPSGQVIDLDEVGPGTAQGSGAAIELVFPHAHGTGNYHFTGRLEQRAGSEPQLTGELVCRGCASGDRSRPVTFGFGGEVG